MKQFLTAFLLTSIITGSGFLSSCENKRATKNENTVNTPAEIKDNVVAKPETLNPEDIADENLLPDSANNFQAVTTSKPAGQRFGHINSADLIELMPETKKAEKALATYVQSLEGQFTGMQRDYQKKVTDFQAQEKSMLENVKQTKIRAIQELEMELQETQAASREKVADKRAELFKPILKKAEKAVKEVGEENNYDYVFDTNAGSFIYTKESHDVMPLVKKKLGLR